MICLGEISSNFCVVFQIKETRKLEKNSVTGTQKTSISHQIGKYNCVVCRICTSCT